MADYDTLDYWRGCLEALKRAPDEELLTALKQWGEEHPRSDYAQGTDCRNVRIGPPRPADDELKIMLDLWAFIRHYLADDMVDEIIIKGFSNRISWRSLKHMRDYIWEVIVTVLETWTFSSQSTAYFKLFII